MLIDCDTCEIRGLACRDCVVTFVTIPVRPAAARPPTTMRLDAAQHAAIDALAAGGLVPPLRHRGDPGGRSEAS